MIRNRPINISGIRHIGNDVRISPFMGIRPSRDARNLEHLRQKNSNHKSRLISCSHSFYIILNDRSPLNVATERETFLWFPTGFHVNVSLYGSQNTSWFILLWHDSRIVSFSKFNISGKFYTKLAPSIFPLPTILEWGDERPWERGWFYCTLNLQTSVIKSALYPLVIITASMKSYKSIFR